MFLICMGWCVGGVGLFGFIGVVFLKSFLKSFLRLRKLMFVLVMVGKFLGVGVELWDGVGLNWLMFGMLLMMFL